MKLSIQPKTGHLVVALIMSGLVGCVQATSDKGVNLAASYEILSSHVDNWQINQPKELIIDKPEKDKPMFRMRFIRVDAEKAAEACKDSPDQRGFDLCVKSAYEHFPIHAINLTQYIESEGYKLLKDNPELRKVLDSAKKDGHLSNGEFKKIITKIQELLTLSFEKQYQENIANL